MPLVPSILALGAAALSVHCGGAQIKAEETPASSSAQSEGAQTAAPAEPTVPRSVNAGSCPGQGLIDDLEDGDNRSVSADSRGGYWYTYADESSKVEPTGNFIPRAQEGGGFSAGMRGEVGSKQYPYVGLGVAFSDPMGAYDASCCKGVSFRARKAGEGISVVRFKVGDWQTTPEGGLCKDCYNDFGATISLSEEWQEFRIAFADMKQEPYWGEAKAAIDTAALYQLQWQVNLNNQPFDIEVDDVALFGCGENE